MTETVDLTDSYEPRDVTLDDTGEGWESWVAWAADRHGDAEDPTIETVEFEAHRGLVEAIDHRTTEEHLSDMDLSEAELAEELEDRNATVDDEWDVDPVMLEHLVADDLGPIEENGLGQEFELGNVYPTEEIPDVDADDVETVTVRLPLREGVATQLEETMDRQDRDPGEFLRGTVAHQAAHFKGPRGPAMSEETLDALPDDQTDRVFDTRKDAMAEWLGRVARGDDIEAATREGWRQIAEVQAEVTGGLDASEAESESEGEGEESEQER